MKIQDDTGDLHGVSQSIVSKTCKKVADALAHISRQFIRMPATLTEQEEIMNKFRSIANFPTVIGAIDCTHIRVKKIRSDGGQMYINRKGYSSINVQVLWCIIVLTVTLRCASGHGRLIEPPSRASAWRFGFNTPHNYNDHELYCGGFFRQWTTNEGKCGVCGDAWDAPKPRAHELGGRFGKGIIVRKYAPQDTVVIKVELTANHFGFFEFRVCEEPKNTTQECLDKYVLKLDGRDSTKYYPKDGNKVYEMKYKLPVGLECSHCVLQWRYIAGNNWGSCGNGTEAVGCGPQEEFRACADITIGERYATTTRRPRPPYVPPSRKPTVPTPEESTGSSWYGFMVAIVTLLIALGVMAGIYLYYYRGGIRIKDILKSKVPASTPVPPPRHKRASLSREFPPELGPPKMGSIPDSGFETVDLRAK